jgi:hypothetical protein
VREPNDWRLVNQLKYLKGVRLLWRRYAPSSPENDHDHCEFCWAKLMVDGKHDSLPEGYSTPDGYRWVCKPCFDDFFDMFDWKVNDEA